MSSRVLRNFLNVKELQGCSEKTIDSYRFQIDRLLRAVDKDGIENITTNDIRNFLVEIKREKDLSNVTLDTMRRIYNSFFDWCCKEKYISDNPMNGIYKIKTDKVLKVPLSQDELEQLRSIAAIREKAIIELLYSTGMRVGECEKLNIRDINWEERTIIVFGKGAKERKVYFSKDAEIALTEYLSSRTDNNEALFVAKYSPHGRIGAAAIEKSLKQLGQKCGIVLYPHKLRRTCATHLLNEGMPVQEVSKILGHAKLETTMIYCTIDDKNVENDYDIIMNKKEKLGK